MWLPLRLIRLASASTRRKRIFSRFAMDEKAQSAMQREVATTYVASYEARLRQLARTMGSSARVRLTDPEVLKRVNTETRDAALGILHTYNDELRNVVKNLPAGMSQKEMTAAVSKWQADRAVWKGKQIAKTTASLGRNDADRDVIEKNAIAIEQRVTPSQSAEPKCAALVARGWIKSDQVDFTLPLHPNCVHGWEYRRPLKNAIKGRTQLWIGDKVRVNKRKAAA